MPPPTNAFVTEFFERWRPAAPPDDAAKSALTTALLEAEARAVAAWPKLSLPLPALAEVLAVSLEGQTDAVSGLAELNVEEIAFAVACGERDPVALAAYETIYAADVRGTIARLGLDSATVDEAMQQVREKLFVGDGDRPAILRFGGQGRLRGWLRVVASRIALGLVRGVKHVALEEGAEAIAGPGNPEIEHLKRTYGRAFEQAFRDSVAALAVSDRLLLKQRFQLGMTVTELANLEGVHASTISRRVTEARERLVDATREAMTARLGLPPGEMSSVLRLIRSQVDLSLGAHPIDDIAR